MGTKNDSDFFGGTKMDSSTTSEPAPLPSSPAGDVSTSTKLMSTGLETQQKESGSLQADEHQQQRAGLLFESDSPFSELLSPTTSMPTPPSSSLFPRSSPDPYVTMPYPNWAIGSLANSSLQSAITPLSDSVPFFQSRGLSPKPSPRRLRVASSSSPSIGIINSSPEMLHNEFSDLQFPMTNGKSKSFSSTSSPEVPQLPQEMSGYLMVGSDNLSDKQHDIPLDTFQDMNLLFTSSDGTYLRV
jgi:hypothetical protein